MMARTRPTTLVLLALAGGLLAWLTMELLTRAGILAPLVPAAAWLAPVLIAAVLLVLGLRVRRLVRGKETSMGALGAARVAMFALAASRVGAALAGAYGGVLLHRLGEHGAPLVVAQAWASGASVLGFVVLAAAGLLVEHWCHIGPQDEDGPDETGRGSDPAPA